MGRELQKRTFVSAVVIVAGICVAWGVWGGPAMQEIHACVKQNPHGDVRIVSDPAMCHSNELALTWNVVGQPGPPGPPGPPGAGTVVHYAEQTADVTAQGISNWLDVTGTEAVFNTPAGAVLDLFSNGAVSTRFGSASFVRCGFRFVIDGVPTGHPLFGDMLVSPARNESAGAEWMSFTVTRRVAVGAGQHAVGLQVAQVAANPPTDLACALDERDYSGARLYVTVR